SQNGETSTDRKLLEITPLSARALQLTGGNVLGLRTEFGSPGRTRTYDPSVNSCEARSFLCGPNRNCRSVHLQPATAQDHSRVDLQFWALVQSIATESSILCRDCNLISTHRR